MPTAMGAPDLLEAIRQPTAGRFFQDAKKAKRSMTAYITDLMQVDEADRKAGLDGLSVIMREADVVSRSIPEDGIYADTVEDFIGKAGRAVFAEWCQKQYRKAQA